MLSERLRGSFRKRLQDLRNFKEKNIKIIGYIGSYIPEELICAGGGVPQQFCKGGESEPAEAALPYIGRFTIPFTRAQFGYYLLGIDPIYRFPDIIVAQCSDCHMATLADLFEFNTNIPVVKIGVPTDWDKSFIFEYYLNNIRKLKDAIEKLTNNEITDEKLKEYIDLYNRMRELLRDISLLRKDSSPPISGFDFIMLNHYSFYSDVRVMIEELESLYKELKNRKEGYNEEKPRILLTGHVLAVGDYVVPKSIEENGGIIVIEQFDEGIRHYWENIKVEGDLIENIARKYFLERIPSSVQVPSWEQRLKVLENRIDEFKIDGVIWYQLKFDEIYNMESYILGRRLKERGIPMLKLESSYEVSESIEPIKIRVESFINLIKESKRKGG